MSNKPIIPLVLLENAINEISKLLGVVVHGVRRCSGDNQNMEEFAQKLQAMKTELEGQLDINGPDVSNKNKL
ncbi:MAG: hypothetical protein EBY16_05495 [Gammaproteobacteria bacterium]|nr:hypothetical protein [Gammaproteobacteria bacterium]